VITLDGNDEVNPVFVFIAGTTLVTAADTYFILENGAKAENVYWALGAAATLGADTTLGSRSTLHGCALAQSAVTFESGGTVTFNHYLGDDLMRHFRG
jgi:hypothetical protein